MTDTAPFSDHETSLEAARAIQKALPRLERAVYQRIALTGHDGLCCHELEHDSGLAHTTASARIRGLVLKGLVVDSGKRRLTKAGRRAKAWRVT